MDTVVEGNVPFSLRYEGPALAENSMDVRDLAPALLAFGNLCDLASRELYGDDSRVNVKIKTVAPGSVVVDMLVWATGSGALMGAAKLWNLVASNPEKVAQVLELVKNGFALAKELKGDKSKVTLDDTITRLVVDHHHTIEFGEHLRAFIQNPIAQADMSSIARPLRMQGIDRLTMIQSNAEVETVSADEVDYIDSLPTESIILNDDLPPDNVSTVEKFYKVLTTSNLPNRKWRLTDGSQDEAISVKVTDNEILQRAASGTLGIEVGFFIKARITSFSRFLDNDLKTEHFLESILEVRSPNKPHDLGPGLL